MPWVHGDWIDDDESLARAPSRWAFDPYLRSVLERSGWVPRPPPAPVAAGDADAHARALLEEFGGLTIDAGHEYHGRDLTFETQPRPLWESEVRRRPFLAGAVIIATIEHGDIVLFVDGRGALYLTEDICHRVYSLGDDFAAVMGMMVRHERWPAPLPE
jgi:hypothetical protein